MFTYAATTVTMIPTTNAATARMTTIGRTMAAIMSNPSRRVTSPKLSVTRTMPRPVAAWNWASAPSRAALMASVGTTGITLREVSGELSGRRMPMETPVPSTKELTVINRMLSTVNEEHTSRNVAHTLWGKL